MAERARCVWNENSKAQRVNFLLKNISWQSGHEQVTAEIRVKDGIIAEIGKNLVPQKKEIPLDFKNHFLYPGLINAHDHLEMNLYPLMGKPPYQNYTEWAKDIYKPKESPVKEIESVAIEDRLLWGGIKNLISGVTTVIHHNPWHRVLSKKKFPVRVLETTWAHSLAFEKDVQRKFSEGIKPFVIHAAEGIDELAQKEIPTLNEMGLLKQNTVLIHAVGLNETATKLIDQRKSSVIWCPSSNFFLFGRTLPLKDIKDKVKMALGSDSTMTGPATLLDEMRMAGTSGLALQQDIYEMVTSMPAQIFQAEAPEIKIGKTADFWISPIIEKDYVQNIFDIHSKDIDGVFVNGELRYGDSELADALKVKGWRVGVQTKEKWCAYDVRSLKKKIERKTNGACLQNSLWQLLS